MISPGDVYGIYTVVRDTGINAKDGHRIYELRCNICGKTLFRRTNKFSHRNYLVHKCTHDPANAKTIETKRLRRIYRGMYDRCYNPKNKDYKRYGKRGIYICDKWRNNPRKFEKWAKKNGYEDDLSIDRIDGNGPYAPENCRWVTISFNSKFTRNTVAYDINGILDSGKGWSTRLGLPKDKISKISKRLGKEFASRYIDGKSEGFTVLVPRSMSIYDR